MDRNPFTRNIQIKGHEFQVIINNTTEENFWNDYESNRWEVSTIDFLVKNARGGTFLDLGSWIGPISLLMSRIYNKVVSVDFDPIAYRNFKKNIEINNITNIDALNIGLSDKRESIRLNQNYFGQSGTSVFYQSSSGPEVQLITFNDLISRIKDDQSITFIKIDIEGAEFRIVNDVYKFLDKAERIAFIAYHPFHLKLSKWRIFKLVNALKQLKYKKYYFNESGVEIKSPYNIGYLVKSRFRLADVLES